MSVTSQSNLQCVSFWILDNIFMALLLISASMFLLLDKKCIILFILFPKGLCGANIIFSNFLMLAVIFKIPPIF